jgi:hypothetical protein
MARGEIELFQGTELPEIKPEATRPRLESGDDLFFERSDPLAR